MNKRMGWSQWWRGLSLFEKVFPLAAILAYWLCIYALKGFRSDHAVFGIALFVLSYGGRHARIFLRFALPFLLTAVIYDSQRFYGDYIRGRVHVEEPYYFDKYFFGIPTAEGILTPNEWFQKNTNIVLDLITGLAYLIFFSIFILQAAYFAFYLSKKGTWKCSAERVAQYAKRMTWSFFWVNMIGYTTYYWYAAAPPWYVEKYGLGPAQMDVPASSAGCARFDQILGTHFFSEMYGRAADVFGAIPSLHVAYPFLAVYFGFKIGSMRTFSVFFYLLMCFSAVYLNHHYILDLIWGSAYALGVGWLVNRWGDSKQSSVNYEALEQLEGSRA